MVAAPCSPSRRERTLAREATVRGVSFLSGFDVSLRFRPADAGTGVVFRRVDLPGEPAVPALVKYVVPRQRRTAIQRGEAVVEMVEHVLAALSGLRIDNCVVDIDAPETPGCDGSSLAFVEALSEAGSVEQERTREALVIDRPVTVREGSSTVTAHPGDGSRLVLSYNLDYGRHTPIGAQSRFVAVEPESFTNELAASRTFLLKAEADALRQAGIGSRTNLSDLLVFDTDGPIDNTLRYPDECVRHKILDMVGDLALLGKDIVGHVTAHRSGHSLNTELVRELIRIGEEAEVREAAPEPAVLDIEGIMKILPHRYPFLLIDRVIELRDDRVAAIKNVTINEPFFMGHWPRRPIMPGVLILEALAQTAGVLIGQWADATSRLALIASIDDVKLRKPVVPGDQLRLEVESLRSRSRTADIKGVAKVGDQLAAEARIRFVLVDADKAA